MALKTIVTNLIDFIIAKIVNLPSLDSVKYSFKVLLRRN